MRILRAVALAAAVLSAGCGDDEPVTPTQPSTPPPTVTSEFSGTLTVNGAATHPFVTGRSGQITVTLTALAPNSAAVIGVSLGTWNGVTCQTVLANDNATQAAQIIGNAGNAGNFCVRVYDVGRLAAPTTYMLAVVHF